MKSVPIHCADVKKGELFSGEDATRLQLDERKINKIMAS